MLEQVFSSVNWIFQVTRIQVIFNYQLMKHYKGPKRKRYLSVFKAIAGHREIVVRKKCNYYKQSYKYGNLMFCTGMQMIKIPTQSEIWKGTYLGMTVLSSFGS